MAPSAGGALRGGHRSFCIYVLFNFKKYIKKPHFNSRTVFIFFLAEQVTSNLKELTQQVTPGDVVSTYGVRKAMGISVPRPRVGGSLVDLTEGACPVSEGRGQIYFCTPLVCQLLLVLYRIEGFTHVQKSYSDHLITHVVSDL